MDPVLIEQEIPVLVGTNNQRTSSSQRRQSITTSTRGRGDSVLKFYFLIFCISGLCFSSLTLSALLGEFYYQHKIFW